MRLGHPPVDTVQEPIELRVHAARTGLVVSAVKHRSHERPETLRGHAHQVRGVMGAAALPRSGGQVRGDRLHKADVSIRGDVANPDRPHATRSVKKLFHAAPVSAVATRKPRNSRRPSVFTPVAISTTAPMTRPPSPAFMVRALPATNVNGPASARGR